MLVYQHVARECMGAILSSAARLPTCILFILSGDRLTVLEDPALVMAVITAYLNFSLLELVADLKLPFDCNNKKMYWLNHFMLY